MLSPFLCSPVLFKENAFTTIFQINVVLIKETIRSGYHDLRGCATWIHWTWVNHCRKYNHFHAMITIPECDQTAHTTVWQLQECKIPCRFPHFGDHLWQIRSYTACNIASNVQRRPSKHLSKFNPINPTLPNIFHCPLTPYFHCVHVYQAVYGRHCSLPCLHLHLHHIRCCHCHLQ